MPKVIQISVLSVVRLAFLVTGGILLTACLQPEASEIYSPATICQCVICIYLNLNSGIDLESSMKLCHDDFYNVVNFCHFHTALMRVLFNLSSVKTRLDIDQTFGKVQQIQYYGMFCMCSTCICPYHTPIMFKDE